MVRFFDPKEYTCRTYHAPKMLDSISKAVGWAGSMTWKGIKPVVHVLEKVYETGVSLTKKELKPYLSKLKRSLTLPKWYVCINSINGKNICFGFPKPSFPLFFHLHQKHRIPLQQSI